jgi:hypothetical protein
MIIVPGFGRYLSFVSVVILLSQVALVTAQNTKGGVKVSYASLGSSRIARFTNANSYPVRVQFSYQGTKVHGSSEAAGEDVIFVAGNFSATYGGQGLSVTSVRITGVMHSD